MRQTSETHEIGSSVNVTDGREARPKFWVAAYTRPRSEKKAAEELSKLGIETYVATQTQLRQWSDRKKKVETVVIPMVIFLEVTSNEEIMRVRRHPLIIKLLTLPGERMPARIPEKQISQLRYMLRKSEDPVEFCQRPVKVADRVRVIRGNLVGLEGNVEKAPDGKTFIVITIDFLGGAKVSVDRSDIEVV